MLIKHEDRKLNALQLLAFGATALYMYKVWKKEGRTLGSNPSTRFTINSDRLVDSLTPWVDLPSDQKTLVSSAAKSFLKNYLAQKGVNTKVEESK